MDTFFLSVASKVIFDFTQQGEPFHYIELIPNAEEEKNLKAIMSKQLQ